MSTVTFSSESNPGLLPPAAVIGHLALSAEKLFAKIFHLSVAFVAPLPLAMADVMPPPPLSPTLIRCFSVETRSSLLRHSRYLQPKVKANMYQQMYNNQKSALHTEAEVQKDSCDIF